MEDDKSVNAPLTRLRRRLSTDKPDEKPLTPNSPKKRGKAKSQLDNIDENAITPQKSTPKRVTRRTAKDTNEEDKPVTPARRSARIKSNTSVLEPATTATESPRALRVTRRNSHLGSDSEAPPTPTRATRRTRKDSTSSLDKVEIDKTLPAIINETIVEESENLMKPTTSPESKKVTNSSETDNHASNTDSKVTTPVKPTEQSTLSPDNQKENISPGHVHRNEKLSQCIHNLINNNIENIDLLSKKSVLNKSTSSLEPQIKRNMRKTKSWSSILSSDEDVKEKEDKGDKVLSSYLSSHDTKLPISQQKEKLETICKDLKIVAIKLPNFINEKELTEDKDKSDKMDLSSEQLFNKEPSAASKPEIIIDNADSHIKQKEQVIVDVKDKTSGDIIIITNSPKNLNDSVEPMDIDQTIPESLIVVESEENEKVSLNHSELKKLDKQPLLSSNTSVSKSGVDLNKTQTNENEKCLQQSCLTSTPIQHHFRKVGEPVNTPIIKSTFENTESLQSPIATVETCISTTNKSKESIEIDSNSKNITLATNIQENDKVINKIVEKELTDHGVQLAVNSESSNTSLQDHTDSKTTSKRQSNSKANDTNTEISRSKCEIKMTIDDENSGNSDISSDGSNAKNNLIHDEASDAGDDYESGDSQNEEEMRYAKENEIVEKGETLTSEDDFHDDSDYEKDSFVVSSAEEDNELLEGTDDDLSMSDNELKMTAKSKKKYNERMAKQQKKASREMFDSRHKNSKKQQKKMEYTSDSSSCDEAPKKQKKVNRMRLDSSHETSTLNVSKKDSETDKDLSVCNEANPNEKEITAMLSETPQKKDPLEISMKKEPKTPRNESLMETSLDFIPIVPTGDANESKIKDAPKQDITKDPLEATAIEDTSSDSDTNNIISNYDSMLNNLNKDKTSKTADTSLNIDMKKKLTNKKPSIIDELNLTQIKPDGKSKKKTKKETRSQAEVKASKETINVADDDSSDSIDMRILLSDVSDADSKKDINIENDIPLKSSEAKTDIRINEDENKQDSDDNFKFFIDTKGTNIDSPIQPWLESSNSNVPVDVSDGPDEEKIMREPDVNTSALKTPRSDKKKKRKHTNTEEPSELVKENSMREEGMNTSAVKTPKSDKKKKQKDVDNETPTVTHVPEKLDLSNVKTPKSDKKKKKQLAETEVVSENVDSPIQQHVIEVKTPNSVKKKKQKFSESINDSTNDVPTEAGMEENKDVSNIKTPKSDKKKKKDLSQNDIEDLPEILTLEELQDNNVAILKTPKSDKKKQKQAETDITQDVSTNVGLEEKNVSNIKTPKSDKKKKKDPTQIAIKDAPVQKMEEATVVEIKTPKSDKKKKKILSTQTNAEAPPAVDNNSEVSAAKTKKDKKNEQSLDQDTTDGTKEITVLEPKENKKKKRKTSDKHEERNDAPVVTKKTNKRKIREHDDVNLAEVPQASCSKLPVPRLPTSIIDKLDDNVKMPNNKKAKVISTSQFIVQGTRRNKPSNYLEESVCLNEDTPEKKKQKKHIPKPKVLPSVPTCSSSSKGFTTNFQIKVVPTETKFVAQSSNEVVNFKDNFLHRKSIKRVGTYELYKKQRNIKLSKF
ncbi:unnamed protein product [Leptosia nina]|uniref:Protein slender lobes n=1 Tax=Leptosia nina TaxID=320188 RepID=A0AAV1JND0_9NEOP